MASTATYKIRSVHTQGSGEYLYLTATQDDQVIVQDGSAPPASQLWQKVKTQDGQFKLKVKQGSKYLVMKGADTAASMDSSSAVATQVKSIDAGQPGEYYIMNSNTEGLVLGIRHGSKDTTLVVESEAKASSDYQMWIFDKQ